MPLVFAVVPRRRRRTLGGFCTLLNAIFKVRRALQFLAIQSLQDVLVT
jgi:hypothetical protein